MSDDRYSFPVVLRDHPALGPMVCPWCGKARNPGFMPFCHCHPMTLNKPITEESAIERWKRDVAEHQRKQG